MSPACIFRYWLHRRRRNCVCSASVSLLLVVNTYINFISGQGSVNASWDSAHLVILKTYFLKAGFHDLKHGYLSITLVPHVTKKMISKSNEDVWHISASKVYWLCRKPTPKRFNRFLRHHKSLHWHSLHFSRLQSWNVNKAGQHRRLTA